MRLLVIEDDPDLNRQLATALTDAGYVVDRAFDGEEGHYLGETEPYDEQNTADERGGRSTRGHGHERRRCFRTPPQCREGGEQSVDRRLGQGGWRCLSRCRRSHGGPGHIARACPQDPAEEEAAEEGHEGTSDDELGGAERGLEPPLGGSGGGDGGEERRVIDREAGPCLSQDLSGDSPLDGLHVIHGRVPHGAVLGVAVAAV